MKAPKLRGRDVAALQKAASELHYGDHEYTRATNGAFILYLITVLLIALSVRAFIGEPVLVDGYSMYPTLLDGERIIVEKLSYYAAPPARGDIVVCYYPGHTVSRVKRVIGLPGDVISVWDGAVYVNGEPLGESAYWNDYIFGSASPETVPEGTVFVMGDNRNHSTDSREYGVGPIPFEKILGRAFCVVWPLNNLREIPRIDYR